MFAGLCMRGFVTGRTTRSKGGSNRGLALSLKDRAGETSMRDPVNEHPRENKNLECAVRLGSAGIESVDVWVVASNDDAAFPMPP